MLLVAAGTAFAGLAVVPAAAEQPEAVRVTAASAFTPLDLPRALPETPGVGDLPRPGAVLDQRTDALKKAEAERLAAEAAAKAAAEAAAASQRASRDRDGSAESVTEKASGSYARPGVGRLTSGFGRRWGRLHAGIDLASGVGSPVRAAAAGTIISAGREGGYGNCVRIKHADGTVTVYAHLSRILVRGGKVSAGEQIGKEGNTGASTGPHLHFEVRVDGSPVNPLTWLRKHGVRI